MRCTAWARETARMLLEEPLPRRWAHTQGVAAQARRLAPILGDDADLVEAAAWLHDIGYAPNIAATGFHPLDGARYLQETTHADEMLCRLVAHHSGAVIEADERGILTELMLEFAPPRQDLLQALTYCDVTTTPDGSPTSVAERISEIKHRYGPNHLVTRSIMRSTPWLTKTVARVDSKRVAYA